MASVRSEEYKYANAKRSMDMIRRLIYGNFDVNSMRLVTLTFRPDCNFDISNIKVCNKRFSVFVNKVRRVRSNFKFIKVAEFTKKGVVHYHMICNVAFLPSVKLAKLWSYGFISISKTDPSISKYLFKYLIKNVSDSRFGSSRVWSRSSNLIKPVSMYGVRAFNLARDLFGSGYTPTFSYNYSSPNLGRVRVYEFNLNTSYGVFSKGVILKGGDTK